MIPPRSTYLYTMNFLPMLFPLGLMLQQITSQPLCRRSNDRVQITSSETSACQNLQTRCLDNNSKERLVGTSIDFECSRSTSSSGSSVTFSKIVGSNQETPISNGGRFSISGGTLTINNIQPEDEGQYRCAAGQLNENMGCLIVSGLARFSNSFCESNFTFEYASVPNPDNSCYQQLSVTEGDDVTFNTRLEFGDQGGCECIEDVRLLQVRKSMSNGGVIFVCDETESNNYCVNKSGFAVVRGASGRPYDFSLVLPSVNISHNDMYYVKVEVGQPDLNTVRRFWKIFELTVNPAPTELTTQPPDDTGPTSQSPGDTSPIERTSTTNNRGLDPPTLHQPSIDIGAAVAGTIVGVLILIAIVSIVIGYFMFRKSRVLGSNKKQISDTNCTSITLEVKGPGQYQPSSNERTASFCATHSDIPELSSKLESPAFVA